MNFRFETYHSNHYSLWNHFIQNCDNATFLFHRDFMEYHRDRFTDASILVFQNEKLIAVCPANRVENQWYSHQGLTYGGLILENKFNTDELGNLILELLAFLRNKNYVSANIKTIPQFYGNGLLLKLRHQLVKHEAIVYRSDMVLAIDYSQPLKIHKTKIKHYKRNLNLGFEIKETSDFSSFWNDILLPRLQEKHQVKPVHSLEEIQYLRSKFPEQIKQFNLYKEETLLAGITIFDTGNVVKSQYGATSLKGEKYRAIEYLFIHLIHQYKNQGKRYFSMGTVTEQNDLGYNSGLLKQKEELGCSLYLQDFLSLKLV